MNVRSSRNHLSKIYSDLTYNIPINNDRSHEGFLQDKNQVQRVVHQKKLIDKIMHGVIKERLFGNFISDQTRLSDQNYINIEQVCRQTTNKRVRANIRSLHRTIDTSVPRTRGEQMHRKIDTSVPRSRGDHNELQTLDISKTAAFFRQKRLGTDWKSKRPERVQVKKLPSLNDMELNTPKFQIPYEKANTTRSVRAEKNYYVVHHKKLGINAKALVEFVRRQLLGLGYTHLIYQVKLTKELIYSKTKHLIQPKFMEKFFFFFGFPSQFGIKQYMSLIENAANTSLKFIHFWVFVLMDQDNNGTLTSQQLFKFIQKFGQSSYIEGQIYTFAAWLEKNNKRTAQGEGPPQELLAANRNLRLEQLKQMLKQTTKQIIEVNCVKNTCYHQTIWSLEHQHHERAKLNQIQNNQEATQKMKSKMLQRKQRLKNQPGLRLRDFYTIFGNKRPKIFCYFISVLANLRPQDYQ